MVVREVIFGKMLSWWRASLRIKTRNSRPTRDPVRARFHSVFGTTNVALFETLPFAGFVLVPHAVSYVTGPSAIVSIVIGLLAATLSGSAFLDLRSRFWKEATSVYDRVYKTGSEAVAFAVAWCSVAHGVAMTSALVRAFSQSLNYLMEHRLSVLSRSLFGWVPAYDGWGAVDALGFMFFMIVWPIVALKLSLPLGRRVVLAGNAVVLVALASTAVLAGLKFRTQSWKGFGEFFPSGYTGVASGAALFYLTFNVCENLMKFVEYSSASSYKLHLKSSLLAAIVISLVLTGSSTMMSLVSSTSNMTTEQPLSEAFEFSDIHLPAKYVACTASIVFLIPAIFIQFERCTSVLAELADDGLVCCGFASDEQSQEKSLVACISVGLLGGVCSACFNVIVLCQMAAVEILTMHILVLLTVIVLQYRPEEAGGSAQKTETPDNNSKGRFSGSICEALASETYYFSTIPLGRPNVQAHKRREARRDDDDDDGGGRFFDCRKPGGPDDQPLSNNDTVTSDQILLTAPFTVDWKSTRMHKRPQDSDCGPCSSSEEDRDLVGVESSELDSHRRSKVTPSSNEPDRGGKHDCASDDTDIDAVVEEFLRNRRTTTTTTTSPTPSSDSMHESSPGSRATDATYRRATLSAVVYAACGLVLGVILAVGHSDIRNGNASIVVVAVAVTVVLTTALVVLCCQPTGVQSDDDRRLNYVYMVAIFLNCALVTAQPTVVAVVFGCWSCLGVSLYLFYGISHSRQSSLENQLPGEHRSLLMRNSDLQSPSEVRTSLLRADIFEGHLDDSG